MKKILLGLGTVAAVAAPVTAVVACGSESDSGIQANLGSTIDGTKASAVITAATAAHAGNTATVIDATKIQYTANGSITTPSGRKLTGEMLTIGIKAGKSFTLGGITTSGTEKITLLKSGTTYTFITWITAVGTGVSDEPITGTTTINGNITQNTHFVDEMMKVAK